MGAWACSCSLFNINERCENSFKKFVNTNRQVISNVKVLWPRSLADKDYRWRRIQMSRGNAKQITECSTYHRRFILFAYIHSVAYMCRLMYIGNSHMRREAQKGVGMEDGVACWRGRGGGGGRWATTEKNWKFKKWVYLNFCHSFTKEKNHLIEILFYFANFKTAAL